MAALRDNEWITTLEQLLDRNAAVDLSPVSIDDVDVETVIARGRLFEFTKKGLVIERPQNVQGGSFFGDGKTIYVWAIRGSQRWELACEIVGRGHHVLNKKTRVPTLKLAWPKFVQSAQRRSFFRASVVGIEIPRATLIPVLDDAALQSDVEPRPVNVSLVNIGGGGIGAEGAEEDCEIFKTFRRYQIQIDLPEIDRPLQIKVKLVHLMKTEFGDHYLGLKFDFENRLAARETIDEVVRFTTWVQRAQLRNQSEKR